MRRGAHRGTDSVLFIDYLLLARGVCKGGYLLQSEIELLVEFMALDDSPHGLDLR